LEVKMRPTKTQYYLDIALSVSKRSTCLRRQYGAIVVKNDEIIATGYNGSPRGKENCIDINYCERIQKNIPAGERYELCKAVHAEQNAIISASRSELNDATMYINGIEVESDNIANCKPCLICEKLIINAGIKKVITPNSVITY